MSRQFKQILSRLKKPSVVLSIVSQVLSLCILIGFNVNEDVIMAAATIVCSIFVTLGIMSNPDTQKKGYGDDILECSGDGRSEVHVQVNGEMVCASCGLVHGSAQETAAQTQ